MALELQVPGPELSAPNQLVPEQTVIPSVSAAIDRIPWGSEPPMASVWSVHESR